MSTVSQMGLKCPSSDLTTDRSIAFAFDTILKAVGGSPEAVAVNLAYPIGDLILLALVVGAVAAVPGWPSRLLVLAAGCGLMAVGDTIYLVQAASGSYRVGTFLDATWPAAMFLMSAAIWISPTLQPRRKQLDAPSFVLPGLAVVVGLGILAGGNLLHVSRLAMSLALAAIAVAGTRIAISLHEFRGLTEARHRLSVTDELTGLANRRNFIERLDEYLVASHYGERSEPLALLFIDLDHFKGVNDSFGHPAGDQLLRQIGPRVRGTVRATDLVARLGGDEFAVLLAGADAEYAATVACRISTALEEPMAVGSSSIHIGASIGIAQATIHASTTADLMRCADVAMYRAKSAHCRFETYEPALDGNADRLRLMEDLREALTTGSLTLYYQPQLNLHDNTIAKVEALVRWQHAKLGLLPPDQFVPLAEETGQMARLTSFVLEQAIAQCARWRRQGHTFAVALNLAARTSSTPHYRTTSQSIWPDTIFHLMPWCLKSPKRTSWLISRSPRK